MAEDANQRLLCRTNGLHYVPDPLRHKYGESTRKPIEDWFLEQLRWFEKRYPDYRIFTLGSNLVFGERFVTYFTVCEFRLDNSDAYPALVRALNASDQAIRRKLAPLWEWNVGAIKGDHVVFVVGWFDFAYFLQHRRDFLNPLHRSEMGSFIRDTTRIKSTDYKVLHDGTIVPFDERKLNGDELKVFRSPDRIRYERVAREELR